MFVEKYIFYNTSSYLTDSDFITFITVEPFVVYMK